MFLCYMHHHQGDLMHPLLKSRDLTRPLSLITTTVTVNYKMYIFAFTEVTIFVQWLKSLSVALMCYMLKHL